MKKVKLLGVLAASTMLLAGCSNAPEPEPEKEAFTEAEVATIKSVLLDQELPFAFHMAVQEYNEEEDLFFVAKGDAVKLEDLKEYSKLVKAKPYSFESSRLDPEDAYILEDYGVEFVEDSVNYYYKSFAGEDSLFVQNAVIYFGQEAKTNNFLMIGFESICVWDSATVETNYGYIPENKAEFFSVDDLKEMFEYTAEGVLTLDGHPEIAKATTAEAAAEAAKTAAESYVVPGFVEDEIDLVGVEDIQFVLPLFYGSPYSSGFHSNVTLILSGYTETEYGEYETALTTAGYVLNASTKNNMWKDSSYYELEVENVGTYVTEILFDSGTSGSESYSYAFVCLDFFPAE